MKVSLNWLKEYVDFNLFAEELAERFNMTGTAVESIDYLGQELKDVVVGQIKTIRSHPNADNLTLCLVNVGDRDLQIVCGARNMKEGDKVPVALVGAVLPSGFQVKKTKIRGIESEGMMCSEAELGLGEDTSGLMILSQDIKVETNLAEALNLIDVIFELDITPNRPDCLSLIGIAREVAVITGGKLKMPAIEINETSKYAHEAVEVEIVDGELCPRYGARVITDVTIGPSPLWLQRKLLKAGMRPINNVVDVTNYVMLELGQPLHAFDFEKIKGKKVIVRRARKDEVLLTLDNFLRKLDEEMLVIADTKEPIALAGVMGGAYSEVSENTKTILLESANFNPVSIMRTSRKLGLLSESSNRFEKGVDPNGAIRALARAAQLIIETAGGAILKDPVDVYPQPIHPRTIRLRPARANNVLGINISDGEMIQILESIELKVSQSSCLPTGRDTKTQFDVIVPTFRPDLEREIDLIEEIARLYGFDKIPSTLPASREKRGSLSFEQKISRQIKDFLIAAGLNEVITYNFIDPVVLDKLRLPDDNPLRKVIKLKNPLSEEQSIMRTSLIPGLLQVIQHNVNRGEYNVRIFEIGRTFFLDNHKILPKETVTISGALTGTWEGRQWYKTEEALDFFDVKGLISHLLESLGIKDWLVTQAIHPIFHPGRCAEVIANNQVIGIFGEIHPDIQIAYDLPERVVVFELEEKKLISLANLIRSFTMLPKYPGITLDLAVVVDKKVSTEEVEKIITQWGTALLKKIELFDLYAGKQVLPGKKSLAYSLTYRADDRTLTSEEVSKIHDRVIKKLKEELKAEIRA